ALPTDFGNYTQLKKLALAGKNLKQLPAILASCTNFELVRLSANNLKKLDNWLLELPKLACLAFAGNPFNNGQCLTNTRLQKNPLENYEIKKLIVQGSSGLLH
ncbi:protein kinase, partial [Pseudoalteromonas sp. S1691]